MSPRLSGAPGLRLVAFAALAAFAAANWSGLLLADPPTARVGLATLVVVGGGGLVLALASVPSRRAVVFSVLATLAALGLALVAIGIPARLLWPAGWGELADELSRGLGGLGGDVDYPYRGANEWSRLAVLAGLSLGLALAGALAFWPARPSRADRLRLLSLLTLVGLYVVASAAHTPGAALGRGLLLFVLVAAWVWLPRLHRRDAIAATVALASAALIAVPVAMRLDGEDPWLDYTRWGWSAPDAISYRWDHSYDVLGWPRDGLTMFEARSDQPAYWRAVVLDRFDGYRWLHSEGADGSTELPERIEIGSGSADAAGGDPSGLATLTAPVERPRGLAIENPQWVRSAQFTIGDLESGFVLSPGTALAVDGLDGVERTRDGTAVASSELGAGDRYEVTAYVPTPSAQRMRAAPAAYPARLARYTRIGLPTVTPELDPRPAAQAERPVDVPLRDGAGRVPFDDRLVSSPYAKLYREARRLGRGTPTAYDAVVAVQRYLGRDFTYDEDPPYSRFPLADFIATNRVGFCQHFSGAMALMLRSIGIPARVAGGFLPGAGPASDSNLSRVEDFDAHSWVEVFFTGIGWVAFDPTPPATPTQTEDRLRATPLNDPGGAGGDRENRAVGGSPEAGSVAPDAGGGGFPVWTLILVVPLGALGAGGAARWASHRRRPPDLAREVELRELEAALPRLGQERSPGLTLLALERRFERRRMRRAADYVRRLRAGRFARESAAPPGLAARRALRRELSAGRGLRARISGLRALPPGGPSLRFRA